jgi:O-antigen/teichoic acid export membrane protein
MAGALLSSAAILVFWRGAATLGGIPETLSAGTAILLFFCFLLFQQRIYYLLGTHEHTRARTLQLLWSDLWFLPLLLFPVSVSRNAETVVWTWSAWLLVVLVLTHRWVPSVWRPRQVNDRASLRATFLQSVPILPVLVSDWVYRLTGHYALVFYSDTATMAFYSLAMNLALTAQVAGIPLVDLCCVELGRAAGRLGSGPRTSPSATEVAVFTRAVRHIVTVALPVSLALVFLSDEIVAVLAGRSFAAVALLLPWAALLPALWLANLLLARVLMLLGKPSCVAFGSIAGAVLAVLLCIALVPSHNARGAFAAITIATAVVDALFAARMRVWMWVRLRSARWRPMLGGVIALCLLYGYSGLIGGGPLLRLVLIAGLTLLILIGTGWIRRQDFRSE